MAPIAQAIAMPQELSEAADGINGLEDLEDYYFEADKHAKISAVAAKVVDCVDRVLAAHRPPAQNLHVQSLFLKGRALSFLPGQESKSEELLSKAIKLEPKFLAAWNALGEVHWNTQNYIRARECFEHALEFCGQNPVSLRSLSMVLRAIDGDAADEESARKKADNYAVALDKAKAAVALDASDPQNWETLGNAFMGDFFVNAKRPDELSRALIAYSKAEVAYEKLGKINPSLQMNRGMTAKYMEDYDLALRSFRKAQEIGVAGAARESQKVVDLVQRLADHANRRGLLKAKHVKELLEGFTQQQEGQGTLQDFRASSTSAFLAAKVVAIVERQDELPVIVICCDSNGDVFALSLYNAQQSKVADALVPMKSLLHIRQCKFREISVTGIDSKKITYPCIRVAHPNDVTVVGSGTLGSAAAQSQFTAAAFAREPECDTARLESEETPCEEAELEKLQSDLIDEEDAQKRKEKSRKEKEKAKRRQRKDRQIASTACNTSSFEEPICTKVQDVESNAELETNEGSESCMDNDIRKETLESAEDDSVEKVRHKVRWSELSDSDSDYVVPGRC
jgi:tetratricopeptide (TPR) repeat protein